MDYDTPVKMHCICVVGDMKLLQQKTEENILGLHLFKKSIGAGAIHVHIFMHLYM